jgi:uncharacterized membrane-anchored protein
MTLNWGYALSSALFIAIFVVAAVAQISAKRFHPFLYWAVIVATTTAGTTMADFADRSLGIGYPGGSVILFVLLLMSLAVWYWQAGSISVDTVASPKVEMFYWTAILFSQTLGTALGDWMADSNGLGYERGALVFAAGLVLVAAAYLYTNVSRTILFWTAFILTRPLGATLGDLLDKPVANGGLAFGRFYASAILAALIVALILLLRNAQVGILRRHKRSRARRWAPCGWSTADGPSSLPHCLRSRVQAWPDRPMFLTIRSPRTTNISKSIRSAMALPSATA